MLKNIITFLKKPYYYKQSKFYRLLLSFGLSLFIILFILHFKPLDIGNLLFDINLFAFSTGIISLIYFLLFYFVLVKLFPSFFHPKKWTIGKQLFVIFIILFLISISLWICFYYFLPNQLFNNISYFKIIKLVLGISLIPLVLYFFIDEKYGRYKKSLISKKTNEASKALTIPKKEQVIEYDNVKIFAQNNKDFVEFNVKNLLYIKSNSNYSSFFIIENDILKEVVLRTRLKTIENVFKANNTVFRCHKSYIVNTNYITEITGNSKGFYCHLDDFSVDIPVSRKFKKDDLLKLVQRKIKL